MVTPMPIQSKAIQTRSFRSAPVYIIAAGGILVVLLLLMLSTNEPAASKGGMRETTDVIHSSVGGVDYYHCPGGGDANVLDLVLLHGAHFTKQDWKTSGIFDELCQTPQLSATALDLNSQASHEDLKNILDALKKSKIIKSKPVALVTSSASGYTIVDWISQSTIESLLKYVGYWIPVASPSYSSRRFFARIEGSSSTFGNLRFQRYMTAVHSDGLLPDSGGDINLLLFQPPA
jgi:hypothetical protein